MNKLSTLIIILILLTSFITNGQNTGFGAGVILGEPTGISSKLWIDDNTAIDFGLGYSFIPTDKKISLHSDYLYHLHKVTVAHQEFPIYYGFGVRLRFMDSKQGSLGARGVIGALWFSKDLPLDVFIEIVPVFQLLPKTSLLFDAGIGARYYFY
jgi:hypothetical protein